MRNSTHKYRDTKITKESNRKEKKKETTTEIIILDIKF